MNNENLAIESYLGFCESNELEMTSDNTMRTFESYNNYFDILDGVFESFEISEDGLIIATEGFNIKNIFTPIKNAIIAAWNWFVTKIKEIKEKLFGKSKKQLRKENEDLSNQNAGLKSDIEKQKEENEKKIKELENKLKNASVEREEWKKKADSERSDKHKERDAYVTAINDQSVTIAQLSNELHALKEEKAKLEEANKKISEEKENSENKLKTEKEKNPEILVPILNQIFQEFINLKDLCSLKIKTCTHVIDDIADGVKLDDIEDLGRVRERWMDSGNDKMRGALYLRKIEEMIEKFKDKSKDTYSYLLPGYVEKISKGIDKIVADVRSMKDDFVKTVSNIERKRISGNISTVNVIIKHLQEDYMVIQNIAVKACSLTVMLPLGYNRLG